MAEQQLKMDDGTMEVRLTALDAGTATLELPDGQTLAWPVDHLPADAALGAVLTLRLSQHGADQVDLARAMLNEVLQDNDPPPAA